ncbi:hypothetical protein EW145_g2114 [Phellinidium pouzarii]|uniref:Uncharacterized protein n=1 Tax=Phellinidium pouzarii TaxID=167371 RepID=A0A4S4LCC2_9AGAM|nr:hypothetical protein EW145_g2114 [Phellinidium pouzarii]
MDDDDESPPATENEMYLRSAATDYPKPQSHKFSLLVSVNDKDLDTALLLRTMDAKAKVSRRPNVEASWTGRLKS